MVKTIEKFCLITGATSGIGKAAAFRCAKEGYNLLLLGRNEKVGNQICKDINEKFETNSKFYKINISSLSEIKLLVNEINKKYDHIDLLINNAGARFDKLFISEEGYELTFATNYLGHFCLTLALLGLFKTASKAIIINIVSNAHYEKSNNIGYLPSKDEYKRHISYGQSKLALVMFSYKLANEFEGTNIIVTAYDPGYVATNFARNNGILAWIKFRTIFFLKRKLRSSRDVADDLLYLVNSEKINNISGKYFAGRTIKFSSYESYDQNAQLKLWKISEELCKHFIHKI